MGSVSGLLKWVVLVVLEKIPEWWAGQYRGWTIISQILAKISQEMNIVQSYNHFQNFPFNTSETMRNYYL